MKKMILMILALAVAAGGFLHAYESEGYYNRHNEYDNYAYADYEFQHSNAAFHIDRYHDDIYYFHHYRANVYFVLVGPRVFVVPALTFRRYMHRHNFSWASRADFIALSAVHFPYYDSYVRFGYYFDYYDHNPWCVRNHLHVTRNYRKYYRDRSRSKRYYRHLTRISPHQSRAMERARHFRKHRSANRHDAHTYRENTYRKNQRNVSRRYSSEHIRRTGGENYRNQNTSQRYKRNNRRSSSKYRGSGRRDHNDRRDRRSRYTKSKSIKKRSAVKKRRR